MVAFLLAEAARTAELGREVKAYGPEVPVPATAAALDRMLGLTGRDPHWQAGTPMSRPASPRPADPRLSRNLQYY